MKVYGTFCTYLSGLNIWLSYTFGIIFVKPETAGLNGISIIFLEQSSDLLQYYVRQAVILESMMVNVEKALILTQLPAEK